MRPSIIDSAKAVIEQEIAGLKALEDALDSTFTDVVNLLTNLKGKVIISGMGKSGHIARKIAATLASTGTSAFFVHPAEASHGDLGMISQDDAVILLSNSGETSELMDIIHYSKRFSIPLISIVRRASSSLVDAADFAFVLPDIAEASPVNAPTTSTTMMLAWGDAMAVAVLEQKGFTKDDFGVFHPGGKLGSQFIKVVDLMKTGDDLPVISADTSMQDVLIIMTEKSLGCAIVVENDNVIGIITDGDLRRHVGSKLLEQTAGDIMTKNPTIIDQNTLAVDALVKINDKKITGLCVVDNHQKLAGFIHIHQLLQAGI